MRAGDMPACIEVRVVRTSKWALLVADAMAEEWIPLSQIIEGGDLGVTARAGDHGILCIPRWLAQDRGFEWW